MSINQFVAPSQVDRVTSKCRKGKKCFSSVWLNMRVNDCYRKKRPYRPILLFADEWAETQTAYGTCQDHKTEQWWDLDENTGVLTPGPFFPLPFLFLSLHMTNFLRSIVKNALGNSMNITGERRRSVLGHITLYPKMPLHPSFPQLSEPGLGHSEKK